MTRMTFGGPRRRGRGDARARARLVSNQPAARRLGALLAAVLAGAALAGPAQAVDFVVTNLDDSGACS